MCFVSATATRMATATHDYIAHYRLALVYTLQADPPCAPTWVDALYHSHLNRQLFFYLGAHFLRVWPIQPMRVTSVVDKGCWKRGSLSGEGFSVGCQPYTSEEATGCLHLGFGGAAADITIIADKGRRKSRRTGKEVTGSSLAVVGRWASAELVRLSDTGTAPSGTTAGDGK